MEVGAGRWCLDTPSHLRQDWSLDSCKSYRLPPLAALHQFADHEAPTKHEAEQQR
jgi:hypothetical protein